MALVNMKSIPEKLNECCMVDEPEYPYGLRIELRNDSLAKLGITELPKVGSRMTLTAIVEVCGTSTCESRSGEDLSLDLQITDMSLGTDEKKDAASILYGEGGNT